MRVGLSFSHPYGIQGLFVLHILFGIRTTVHCVFVFHVHVWVHNQTVIEETGLGHEYRQYCS